MQLCSDNNLSVSTPPFSRPLILGMPPPPPDLRPSPSPCGIILSYKGRWVVVGWRAEAAPCRALLSILIVILSLLGMKGGSGGWGNHPRKIFQHKIVQQINNNNQQTLNARKKSC